ncbi:hypothetical protein [Bosea sp. NBC_00550]|uniref:hypothetical protein n=1 Tax=Bosea sp. NBC_00550 TaxID=2969621 RepID=UPI002230AE7E|nr:hypothetical protein [Bosea sp. NBC_00550]UZF90409.1 hypothetical protein NWE53_14750 [Bosea sp. NBC_00550]
MSTAGIRQRVAKLESVRDAGAARQHLIEARSEDAKCKEAELIASGAARQNDLFIVIRRFAAEDFAA